MSEGEVNWRRVSRGIFLVGVGAFLLLNTLGILGWSFWRGVFDFWPVLLLAIGVRLVFEHSRTPWLILLSPLLVLGTMSWVALGGPGRGTGPQDWTDLRAARPAGALRWNFEASLAMARFDVVARPMAPGLLVEGRGGALGGGGVSLEEDRDAARVRLANEWFFGAVPRGGSEVELGVAPEPPSAIDLHLAMTDTNLDLASARLSHLNLGGALNKVMLRLGPADSQVALDLAGAFNAIELLVPSSVPVRVDSRGFLNSVSGRKDAATRRGPGYRVRLRGAFNRLEVRSQ